MAGNDALTVKSRKMLNVSRFKGILLNFAHFLHLATQGINKAIAIAFGLTKYFQCPSNNFITLIIQVIQETFNTSRRFLNA